jgi:hypothetical protein
MQPTDLKVDGMTCASCAASVPSDAYPTVTADGRIVTPTRTTIMKRNALSLLMTTAVSISSAVLAAPSPTFMNGESVYGRPAQELSATTRTVDLRTARYANVRYGETVVFQDGQRQFAWTFDGFDFRSVPLVSIAPSGFSVPERFRVHVGRDQLSRN